MGLLFSSLPNSLAELIRLCEGQNATFSMSMLLVLNQLAEKCKNPANQQVSTKGLGGAFWSQLVARCINENNGVLKRHIVSSINAKASSRRITVLKVRF